MRFWPNPNSLLCLIVLATLAAVACQPASAQSNPAAAAPSPTASAPAVTQLHYLAPSASLAPPRPAAAAVPAASSNGPDPGRKWEVEFHAGFMLASDPRGGTGALPGPGPTFNTVGPSTTRAVPSFYFGDGSLLTGQFATALGNPNLTGSVQPLDPILTSSAVNRGHGAALGARLSRDLTPRFGVELNLDYNSGTLSITHRALDGIAASNSSWGQYFTNFVNPAVCGACTAVSASSVPVIHNDQGHQLFVTGGVNVNLVTQGRVVPYLSGGLGVINDLGDTPFATLTGNYQYTFIGTQTFHAVDLVTLRYQEDNHMFTGYFGGGVKYYVTPRWGIRVDVRDSISPNSVRNLLDANGSEVQVGAAGTCAIFGVSPDLQDCNNPAVGKSTLSGAPFTGFRTFSGDGIRHQLTVTGGLFWRF
ncbi:MAG TPA: hypothetical protein VE825_01695 [Terriglobales bacterium]|jgi:hypothetical protein|nr:hypothetical protein [Terriglobales bacterium]